MLNTVNNATGLVLEYEKEIFLPNISLNTVQYVLKDADNNKYLLLVSFDKIQDYFLDREMSVNKDNIETDLIWSGKTIGHRCSLYRYYNEEFKKRPFIMYGYKDYSDLTEDELLENYPCEYRNTVKNMSVFRKCFKCIKKDKYISKVTEKVTEKIRKDRRYTVECLPFCSEKYDLHHFALNDFAKTKPNNKNYRLLLKNRFEEYYLPVSLDGEKAFLGTWMNDMGREAVLFATDYIFKSFKVKTVEYTNVLYSLLYYGSWRHNDWFIPLPETVEELKARLAQKGRYNLKRERRIIEEKFGGLELVNVPYGEVTEEIKELFYYYKSATHGVDESDYDISKRNLTDIYLLKLGTGETKGIALSCEQGDIAFIENHTFDSTMRGYSFGQVLYDMYLDEMIHKKKKGLALAGGNLEYKKRYGSSCAIARSGTIGRPSYRWGRLCRAFGISMTSHLYYAVEARIYKHSNIQ